MAENENRELPRILLIESGEQVSRPVIAEHYPASYFDMLDTFEAGQEEIVISFDTANQAYDFRLDFYSFRSALEKDGSSEMYPAAKRLAVRVLQSKTEGGKTDVIIGSRDRSEHAKAVANALKALKQ